MILSDTLLVLSLSRSDERIFVDDDGIDHGNDEVAGKISAARVFAQRFLIDGLVNADRTKTIFGFVGNVGPNPAHALGHLGLTDAGTAARRLLQVFA